MSAERRTERQELQEPPKRHLRPQSVSFLIRLPKMEQGATPWLEHGVFPKNRGWKPRKCKETGATADNRPYGIILILKLY